MAALTRTRHRAPFGASCSAGVLAVPALALLLGACAGQGDIDRTQPDKVDKSIFLNADGSPRTFYYRKTTVGAPPTSNYVFEGTMGDLQKVRFDILEKYLVGYRAYDYAPGSETTYSSGANNNDTPLLMFAITSQFDVKREYNPGTGEQTNVISENTTDRPWNQRQYIRLDWSKNLVDPPTNDTMNVDPMSIFFPATTLQTGFSVGQGDQAYINPDRPIVTKDYIDIATKELRTPDLNACATMFDPLVNDGGIWGCGPAEITYRNSLLPVPPLTYVPLSYPDTQALTDGAGNPIRYAVDPATGNTVNCDQASLDAVGLTGADCTDLRMDRFAKFGYFRTIRQTYDREVGATEAGRQYFINRWNIWQDAVQKDANGNPAKDANGDLVPMAIKDRQTRTITYYMNPEFPAESPTDHPLRDAAAQVIGDWNQAAKETAAGMLFHEQHEAACIANPTISNCSISPADLKALTATMPDIFVLKPNSCEVGNVQQWVMDHPSVVDLVKAKVSKSTLDVENFAPADLLKACSALSAVTENLPDGDANKFTWQRNGDLRYSFLYWVDRPQPSGPLGYGPSSADPETGEIISAGAYIYGAALDTYAKFAVDSVNLANGNLDPDDLLSGKTITDVLAETKSNRLAAQAHPATATTLAAAGAKISAIGPQATRLVKVGAGIDDQVVGKLKGTAIEKLLLNDDVLPGLVAGYQPGDTLPDDYFEQAMAQPWFSRQAREAREQKFQQIAQHGCMYMAEFADDAIMATALKYDQLHLGPDDMWKALRGDIFRGLADHEVGHTMGLRHNFAASTDALNYDDRYWQLHENASLTQDAKDQMGMPEFATASVMDYGARFNSDIQGLGKYDTAAMRFGYGELVDIIPQATENAWTGLNNDIFLNDYTKLPKEVGGLDNMSTAGTRIASYADDINIILHNGNPFPERPYKFCIDEWQGSLDCKTWDRGANQQEIVDATADAYRNYYVFNAYKRGRTTWQIDGYLNRMASHYFVRYTEAFQFFFFYYDLLTSPQFVQAYPQSTLAQDMLNASIDALNSLGTVLQTPQPGIHCTTAYSPYVLTVPIQPSDCDQTSMQVLNLPDAKPYYVAFSDDTYYRITRAGSLYDKLLALDTLTTTEAEFVRVDAFESANRYSINFYQVFQNEVLNLLSGVIRNDPTSYTGMMAQVPGSTPPQFQFQPTPVVDTSTYGVVGAQTPLYAQPNAVHVETPVNKTIEYWTLLYALGRLGSSWDSTLDFQNYIQVSAKGADDDFTVAATTPVHEFTHPTTGTIYRAPAYTNPPSIGAAIIDELNAIVGTPGVMGTVPVQYGTNFNDGSVLPTWYTAKASMDALAKGNDQTAYTKAIQTFTMVDQLMGFQVDLISDIRLFRKQVLLLNGLLQ
jgi:hypothetical protein